MGVGSGIGSSFGMVPESTYGTYVAPTKFLEGTAKLKFSPTRYQGGGMAAGRLVQPGTRRVETVRAAGGTFECNVMSKQMGHLINGLLGGTVTPVQQGGSAAWLQTHNLSDPFGKFYTMQAGIPDLQGTVRPYTFLGCQVVSIEWSCETGGPLTMQVEVVARDVSEAQSLAAPSFPAVNEFHFAQATFKLGTFGAEASVAQGIRKVSLKVEAPRHAGGPYMGNSGLRSQGVLNNWVKISGTVETDFDAVVKTGLADRFAANTSTSMVWEFVGPLIGGGFFETIRFTVPQTFFDDTTPQAESPDVVQPSFPFVGQNDLTNPGVRIEYISTDTTL